MSARPSSPAGVTRRALLLPLGAVAAASLLGGLVVSARDAVRRRPAASGTSATRCAQCGAGDHAMLDVRCPAAPRVL